MNVRTGTHKGFRLLLIALIAGAPATTLANAVSAQQTSTEKTVAQTSPANTPHAQKSHEESEGERVFAANCSRCHTTPDGFSQRISGTIVRHMRVRASLSEQDEKTLLRFFNP